MKLFSKIKVVFRRAIAPIVAAVIIIFLIIGIGLIILTLLRPELLVAIVVALGAFMVLVAIFAGPSLVKAALRR